MFNIVYMIILKREQFPNKYIGSKSNCTFKNNRLYDCRNKVYYGSAKDKTLKDAILAGLGYDVYILGSFSSYDEALKFERLSHLAYDVVASKEFFNKSIACESTFTNPNYATYKNIETGKVARLLRNHPLVLNGEWVGISKGTILTQEDRKKRGLAKEKNGFFGKKHTQESREKISNSIKNYYNSDDGILLKSENSKRAKITFSGIPKTEEHRKKIGRKNLIQLKNKITGETKRINKEDAKLLDLDIWKNPSSFKQRKIECEYCGIISTVGMIKRWHGINCKQRKLVCELSQ